MIEYIDYLKQGLVAPTAMELFTCNVDGSDLKQLTQLGKANWAPFYHPSGKKIIFSSNHKGKRGFEFNLFMINTDGSGLEQISYDKVFDSFPMFSERSSICCFSGSSTKTESFFGTVSVATCAAISPATKNAARKKRNLVVALNFKICVNLSA